MEKEFMELFHIVPHPLLFMDASFRILKYNEAFAKWSGLSDAEISGVPLKNLFSSSNDGDGDGWIEKFEQRQSFSVTLDMKGTKPPLHAELKATCSENAEWIVAVSDRTELHQLQKAYQQSEVRFNHIMEQIREIVWMLDVSGNIFFASTSVHHILGYTPAELEGTSFFNLIHPDDMKLAMQEYRDTLHKKNPHLPTGVRLKNKEQQFIFCDVVAENLLDNPFVEGMILTTYDITWRWKAENELRESEERFRRMSEAAFEGIAIIENFTIVDANPQISTLFGYSRDEFIGMNPLNMVHPGSLSIAEEAIQKAQEGPYEIKGIKNDGTTFHMEIRARNLKQIDRELRMVAIRDLSSIKLAMDTVVKSESKLRKIFNSTSDGILISDLEHHCLEANETCISLLKLNKNDITGYHTFDFVAESMRPKIVERLQQMIRNEITGTLEVEIISPKTGASFPAELNSRLTYWGDTPVILSVIRDISERKKLESKLFDTIIQTEEQERGRIAADLHDELGPLLSGMNLYLNAAYESEDRNKSIKALEQLKIFNQDAIATVREISASLSPGILDRSGLSVAVERFLETCRDFFNIKFESHIGEIRFPSQVEIVYYRIVRELVNNTIRHAGATSINLQLFISEEALILIYGDNGIGFDLSSALSKPAKGMGIQNIISRCKAIDANLEMQSEPGKGFSLRLSRIIRNELKILNTVEK